MQIVISYLPFNGRRRNEFIQAYGGDEYMRRCQCSPETASIEVVIYRQDSNGPDFYPPARTGSTSLALHQPLFTGAWAILPAAACHSPHLVQRHCTKYLAAMLISRLAECCRAH